MSDDRDAELYPFTPPPPGATPPSSGDRPRRPRRSRLTKTAAGLAVILGTGTGAAAVALATSSGSVPASATSSASYGQHRRIAGRGHARPRCPGAAGLLRWRRRLSAVRGGPASALSRGPGAFGGPGGLFGAIGGGGIVHASYTLKDAQGTYETIDTQVGTAEDVSSSSLTVKSADGFSQTYDITTSTIVDAQYEGILSVKVGDTVSVQALANGSTITAQRVQDVTQLQASRPIVGGRPRTAAPAAPVPAPAAPATAAATTTPAATTSTTSTTSTTDDEYHRPPGGGLASQPPGSCPAPRRPSQPPRPLSGPGG